MVDIDMINEALELSSKEYDRQYGIRKCYNLPGIFDAYNEVFDGITRLSEQYLRGQISNAYALEESLECLRYHIQKQAIDAKNGALRNYMKLNDELN